jgi:hypothetical protein
MMHIRYNVSTGLMDDGDTANDEDGDGDGDTAHNNNI